jgi:hypothetical protein
MSHKAICMCMQGTKYASGSQIQPPWKMAELRLITLVIVIIQFIYFSAWQQPDKANYSQALKQQYNNNNNNNNNNCTAF